ncbi:MAG: PilZ domain-containing protein [Candidatus Eremiobacteraeota bacterium]|nr:PilZ domain-containing protein [Candidatus Eremiobacteraeota bacterium]
MLRNVIQSIESMDAQEISNTLVEKRRGLRVKSYAQVRAFVGDKEYKAIVVELGVDGLRMKSMEAPFEQGQEVELRYASEVDGAEAGPVRVQLAWVQKSGRDLVAGARYVDTRENMRRSWVRFLLTEIGFDDTRTYQRRKFIRVDASIPSRIFRDEEVLVSEARLVNIGIGGCLLESAQALEKDQQVTVEMSLWRILPTLRLPATVIALRNDPDSGLALTSLQFGVIDPSQVKLLGNYVINMINQSSPV